MEATFAALNTTQAVVKLRPEKKLEYLHKVSDVYHNNYLMQCLKVIYVDGNRSLIHKRELSPWYISVPAEKRLTF